MATDPADIAYVRLLISDVSTNPDDQLLTDEQISSLIENNRTRRRAAAEALEIIAASEVLISKKITTQDLSTDGPAVANALLALAKRLRDSDEEDEVDEAWGMEIVDGRSRFGLGWPEVTERPMLWHLP